MDEIHTLLESNPDQAVGWCRKVWLPSLVSASQFQLAERLAFDGILAAPWQSGSVEALQETRVNMMLRSNRPAEALINAHSLFNIASLRGTQHAILVLVACLKAVHGDDSSLLRQFRKEEIVGATTRPVAQVEPTSRVIAAISIDAAPYASAIAQFISDDDQSRRAKANLMLLAGRCEEALAVFQAMNRLSESADRTALAENVARAIKAADGTIGRANGYMLSQADELKSD